MNIKRLSTALNSLYLFILILLILEEFTAFDIRSQLIKSFVYFGTLILSFVLPFWNLFVWKWVPGKIMGTVVPVAIAVLMMRNIGHFTFAKGVWETEVILYENKNNSFQTIEFQMQDIGALGYNDRTVQVTWLTGWFRIVTEVPREIEKNKDWVKVNQYVGPDEPRY